MRKPFPRLYQKQMGLCGFRKNGYLRPENGYLRPEDWYLPNGHLHPGNWYLTDVPGNTRHPDLPIRPGACLRASAASSIPSSDLVLVFGDHPLEITSSDLVLVLRDPRLPH